MPLDPMMQQRLLMQQMFQGPNGQSFPVPAGQGGVGGSGLQIGPGMLGPDDAAAGVGTATGGVSPPPMVDLPAPNGPPPPVQSGPYSGPPPQMMDLGMQTGPYSGPPPRMQTGPARGTPPMMDLPAELPPDARNRRQPFDESMATGDMERRRKLVEAIMAAARNRGLM